MDFGVQGLITGTYIIKDIHHADDLFRVQRTAE